MWRRPAGCIAVVALGLLSASLAANGQPSAKSHRIGWLTSGGPSGPDSGVRDFQDGLRDLGYVEGKNIVVEYRYANGNVDRLPSLATELASLPVEIIVTSGDSAALAAKRATKSVPVIATELGLDPVKAGLVASLGRPEGNVTGLATQSEELWQKRLALLKQLATKVSRLAVLWNPANPSNTSCLEEIQAAGPILSMQFVSLPVSDAKTLEQAFASISKTPPEALVICWDNATLAHAKAIADFALKFRLPTLAPLREYVQSGALISFGTSLPAQRRRTAYYVDRIVKGTKPADLPIERPTYFELVVNVTTAKALGLTVPSGFLLLADDLIQ